MALFRAVSGLFLVVAVAAPRLLAPLNRLWYRFGLLLHRIVNPVVMGLLFYATVTPIALVMRLVGKDPLHRAFDPQARTYWIERSPPGPKPRPCANISEGRSVDFISELWAFMRARKKYWLLPIIVMMAVFGGWSCSARARRWPPFIYTIF